MHLRPFSIHGEVEVEDQVTSRAMETERLSHLAAHTYTDEAVCPHCLHVVRDSWELGGGGDDQGEDECPKCGGKFMWTREISITYSTVAGPK